MKKERPWLRLYSELLNNPKVQSLSDSMFRAYINTLCIAGMNTPRGCIPPLNDYAFLLRVGKKQAEKIRNFLKISELLDENLDGFFVHNWDERQFESDNVTVRTQRHREKKKRCNSENGNVPKTFDGTPPEYRVQSTDTDTETETEKETSVLYHPVVPLTQVSNNRNSVSTCASARTHTRGAHDDPRFEEFWSVYPKRNGSNSKAAALKAWTARIREKHTPEEMIEGAIRYANWCDATGKVATEFVQQAATFLGKQKNFQERWDVGRSLNNQMKTAHMKVERLAQDSVYSTNNWVFNQTATIEGVCYEN